LVEIYQCNALLTDENSWTAYHYACLSGNVEVLAYLFRKSHHHYINVYQPPPQSFQIFLNGIASFGSDSCLVAVASQSGSIEMLRFAYTIFHHTRNGEFTLKPSLFRDKLNIICRTIKCQNGPKHTYWWLDMQPFLYEASCGGSLDTLKFTLEELKIQEHLRSGPRLKSNEQAKQGYTSLLEIACRLNNVEIVQYLTASKGIGPIQTLIPITTKIINTDIDVNTMLYQSACYSNNLDTCSPLYVAARSGNIEYVKRFLAYQHHFHDTHTLLHSACVSGKKEMVKLLIDKCGCTNAGNADGDTPLHVACEWGYLDICLLLLERQGCAVNATNARGHTPLSLAVRHNRFEIMQILVQNGANIVTKTKDTLETPLHFASCCIDFRFQFAAVLLENNTCTLDYLNAADKYGDTALFNACRTKNVDLIKQLVVKSEDVRLYRNGITNEMAAHVACRINSFSVLQALVSEGLKTPMQCHQLNYLEQSLLHLACENDAEEIIDYLIDNKICELNNLDYNGQSPLHIACIRGNTRIVKKLLTSANFKITDKDEEENTVLHYICNRDVVDPELIKLICLNGDSMISEQNSFQYNPLHYLCANGGTQILKCFLEHSRNIKLLNIALCTPNRNGGDTPLHIAFKSRKLMMIRFMFNCCAISEGLSKAICLKNSKMKNVLHCVIEHKCKDIPLYDADGRKIPATFAMMAIDLVLQTVNSNIQEEKLVNSFCQTNHKQYTPIQCLITNVDRYEDKQYTASSILSSLADKLSPVAQQRIFSAVTSEGSTLIHLAVEHGCFDIVKCLIQRTTCTLKLTTCNNRGESPLHIACRSHHSQDSDYGFMAM
jgi:ankyrin repeat protein